MDNFSHLSVGVEVSCSPVLEVKTWHPEEHMDTKKCSTIHELFGHLAEKISWLGCLFMIGLTLDKIDWSEMCLPYSDPRYVYTPLWSNLCCNQTQQMWVLWENMVFIHFTGWYTFKLLDSFSNGGFANDVPYWEQRLIPHAIYLLCDLKQVT